MKNSLLTKKLGELCEIKIGKTPRRGVVKYWTNGTLPWATIAEVKGAEIINTNEQITETAAKELNMVPFPKGTVLYTFKLSIGRVGIAGVDLFTNEAIAGFLIKDRKELMPEWLFYVLPLIDYKPFLSNAVKGNTLNKSSLNLLPTPLPPLEIQKQIVERMDKISEAQKLNDDLIQKSDELYQSLLYRDLNPTDKNWETLMLEAITKDISDGNYSSKYPRQSEFVKSGIPFVRANNFKDGIIAWDDMRFISTQKHKELAKGHLKVGDVLIVTRGETGNVALVSEEFNDANINAQIVRINSENLATNRFVFYILQTDSLKKQIRALTTGTTLKQLTVTNLRKIKIHLPSMEIQKQIVAKLSAVQEYKKQLLAQKSKLKELFDSVLHKSMRGEVN